MLDPDLLAAFIEARVFEALVPITSKNRVTPRSVLI